MGRIIQVTIGKANPNNMNGVSRSVHNLASKLHESGRTVEVWGITPTPNSPTPEREYKLRLFKLSTSRFLLDEKLRLRAMDIKAEDVLHFHGCLIPEYFVLSRYAKKVGARWVVSPRGGLMVRALRRNKILKSAYISLIENRFLNEAYVIHSLCEPETKQVSELISHKRVCEIPNGVNFSEISPEFINLPKHRPSKGEVVAGFVGRLDTEQKGLDLLLKALAIDSASGGGTRLEIVGDGPDRQALERLAANLNIASKVKFLGELRGDDKFSFLSRIDYFVHTSRWEGISNSILEALALGVPVLISKETNFGPPVRRWDCGLEIDKNEPEQIAASIESMRQLKESNKLFEMGERSKEMIAVEYDWESIALKFSSSIY